MLNRVPKRRDAFITRRKMEYYRHHPDETRRLDHWRRHFGYDDLKDEVPDGEGSVCPSPEDASFAARQPGMPTVLVEGVRVKQEGD